MKTFPLIVLAILLGLLYLTNNYIPEDQPKNKTFQYGLENSIVQDDNVLQKTHQRGIYTFNFKQLCGLVGIFAILGGIVTFLASNLILRKYYQKEFESYGEELRRQFRLGTLSKRKIQ